MRFLLLALTLLALLCLSSALPHSPTHFRRIRKPPRFRRCKCFCRGGRRGYNQAKRDCRRGYFPKRCTVTTCNTRYGGKGWWCCGKKVIIKSNPTAIPTPAAVPSVKPTPSGTASPMPTASTTPTASATPSTTPTPSVSVTPSVSASPSLTPYPIANGVVCARSCGTCGFEGCASRPGGRENCCLTEIRRSGRRCAVTDPPCVN